jgi:hypothetical protein
MKILLIVTLILTQFLFANDNYGKIDMHGGKSENLINQKNSLSNKSINDVGIIKPIIPTAPEALIKEEKKDDKKENKK